MKFQDEPRTYIIFLGIVCFALLLLSYTVFQARHLITGPVIQIESPLDGSTVKEGVVDIVGYARNISKISLNDRAIFIEEDGSFKERLLLQTGYTIITLKAEDRFGRTTQEILHLIGK